MLPERVEEFVVQALDWFAWGFVITGLFALAVTSLMLGVDLIDIESFYSYVLEGLLITGIGCGFGIISCVLVLVSDYVASRRQSEETLS